VTIIDYLGICPRYFDRGHPVVDPFGTDIGRMEEVRKGALLVVVGQVEASLCTLVRDIEQGCVLHLEPRVQEGEAIAGHTFAAAGAEFRYFGLFGQVVVHR
jgi:hypothetical protein